MEGEDAEQIHGRQLHFIAIGGAGMSGLALVCHELGARVTGSDRADGSYLHRLRDAGLEPRLGHDGASVPAGAEVVISTAVPPDNPELVVARERGQRVLHRGELLAEVCSLRRLIAVAGTHGKTTTAGMMVHALRSLGRDAAFLLGGELPGAGPGRAPANAGWGEDDWLIAEADESDASFLELRPEIAVITNVELDHHTRWGSRAELMEAFRRFAAPAQKIALRDQRALDAIVAQSDHGAPGDQPRVTRFNLHEPGPDLDLGVPGAHNVVNARAALAGLALAGVDIEGAAAALASFPGMLRRLELKGSRGDALIYDDYGHHPTEVAATLDALRELEPRRLIAVFQPHLYSRTKTFAEAFGSALAAADEIGVLDVYPAREQPVGPLAGVSGLAVARAAADRAAGRPVWWLRDVETATRALAPRLEAGDLLVTIGAGDVFRLADALVTAPAGTAGARKDGVDG